MLFSVLGRKWLRERTVWKLLLKRKPNKKFETVRCTIHFLWNTIRGVLEKQSRHAVVSWTFCGGPTK